jgi:hypothetical protein
MVDMCTVIRIIIRCDLWGWGATDIPEQTDDIISEVSGGGSAMHGNSWNFKCGGLP